jgi:hypothetical protein
MFLVKNDTLCNPVSEAAAYALSEIIFTSPYARIMERLVQ